MHTVFGHIYFIICKVILYFILYFDQVKKGVIPCYKREN